MLHDLECDRVPSGKNASIFEAEIASAIEAKIVRNSEILLWC